MVLPGSSQAVKLAELADERDEAERGYTPGQLQGHQRGPGRPPLGEAAKAVESVRLQPALQAETAQRAETDGVTVSEVIRRALREYLHPAA